MPKKKPTARNTKRPKKRVAANRISSGADSSNLTLIYIHGIGNKPAPAALKRQWDLALFGIDMGSRTRMAYWADIRYPQPLPAVGAQHAVHLHETDRPRSDEEFIDQSRRLAPYGKEAEAFAQKLAQRILTQSKKDQIKAESVEATILPAWIRDSVTKWIMEQFIQDCAAYFYNPAQRTAIQERFRALLVPEGGPYFVIAHSLGTVISYDVMRERAAGSGAQTPDYITLGSPLGIDEVQDHLQKPLRIPAPVIRWNNFADLLDPVAFDKTLSDEFAPTGTIVDDTVINRDSLRLSGFNPHSATGYLATRDVQMAVREIVGSSFAEPVAPFVIARDLAAEIADPTKRFPVLIELKEEMSGRTLEEKRQRLVEELTALTAKKRDSRIDPLRRFVAAELTSVEIDRLSARHPQLAIARIWKNGEKRTLLDKSIQVVQAYTAQLGYGATGRGVSWAILDTGIVAGHPHFKTYDNIAAQWDCTEVGPPTMGEITDESGHGTHVAGIIAGTGLGENAAYRGVAPETKLHIYKVLDDHGRGSDSWVIKALDHIASINESSPTLVIHGVNLSLGGPFDPTVYGTGFSPLCRELRRLWRMGVVVCIAAGNEGRIVIDTLNGEQELNLDLSIGDPANLDEAIAVGSVHKEQPHLYGISYFSSRGPTADGRAKPDLVAPGERIISANSRFVAKKPVTFYIPMSGTSMACPHVSGVIAGFLSVRREFIGRPDQVKEILLSHCTDLKRDRYHQGAGLPNLVRMLAET